MQIFGAIDEEQAIGFPVAGKTAAANVRHLIFETFFVICLMKLPLYDINQHATRIKKLFIKNPVNNRF